MFVDDRRISVSLVTVLLAPHVPGSRLTFVEQGIFYDTEFGSASRLETSNFLLDAMGRTIE